MAICIKLYATVIWMIYCLTSIMLEQSTLLLWGCTACTYQLGRYLYWIRLGCRHYMSFLFTIYGFGSLHTCPKMIWEQYYYHHHGLGNQYSCVHACMCLTKQTATIYYTSDMHAKIEIKRLTYGFLVYVELNARKFPNYTKFNKENFDQITTGYSCLIC